MVSADALLDTAIAEGCDIVGCSGLITPSLGEMENVAREMERRGLELPLLIGGATTSRQHTAVRIAPEYTPPVVHVIDASRVVGVVSDLLDPERRTKLDRQNREDQTRLRQLHAERESQPLVPIRVARERRTPIAWRAEDLPAAPFIGTKALEPELATLRGYIDWTFFFTAWELKGRYPQILDHPAHGEAARDLFEQANTLLDTIVAEGSLRARAVYGYWPAAAEGDDILLEDGTRFPMLRQQADHGDDRPGSAPTTSWRCSRPTTTTTPRSWSRLSRTASPRRLPNGSTKRSGESGTRPVQRCRGRSCSASATGASVRRSDTRPVPITRASRPSSTSSGQARSGWS
jgi:5-methyltetrahydrofolate--homocysteine methyltransferase